MIAGNIDLKGYSVEGWACIPNDQHALIFVKAVSNGITLAESPANLPRSDVYSVHNVEKSGFYIDLTGFDLSGQVVDIIAFGNGLQLKLDQLKFYKKFTKYVLGDKGYRFLDNDSNSVRKLLTNDCLSSQADINKLVSILLTRQKYFSDKGVAYKLFILPEKNDVLSHYDPSLGKISGNRLIHRLGYELANQNVNSVYYLHDYLYKNRLREEFFLKTDTHISDYCVDKICEDIFNTLNFNYINNEFDEIDFYGDLLDVNEVPDSPERCLVFKKYPYLSIQDRTDELISSGEGVTNSRIYFVNNKNISGLKLYMFGTSSSRKFFYSLMRSFSSGTFHWSTKFDLVNYEITNADVVIQILPERYFNININL
jgi:hypothetical protein